MDTILSLGNVTVAEFKEFLEKFPEDFTLSFGGESNVGVYADSETKTVLVDDLDYLEMEFGEI